jgi:hypothetical protein
MGKKKIQYSNPEEVIEVKRKGKPIILKKKKISKSNSYEAKISKLKTTAHLFLVSKRHTKEKRFKWVVVFTNHQSTIRGEVAGVFLRKRFKVGKDNTEWGPVKRIILTEGERLNIEKLPDTHIKFLLNEMNYIK